MSEPTTAYHVKYRADVDGLRALAIIAVIGCHLNIHSFNGGFVGVDIFFVISGFLIGSSLLREIAITHTIDYAAFYERRIRRIIPALLVVLLVTWIVAYTLYLPKDLVSLAQMELSAIFFCSNLVLAHAGGYFDFEAANNLLTHTWSLGVEEQFYIVLPVILLLFRKQILAGKARLVLWWMTGVSFLISVPATFIYPNASFYLLPTRLWELLLGTLLFLYTPAVIKRSNRVRTLSAIVGLLMLAVPVAFYKASTPFPGLTALPPCLGIVLLIGNSATVVHRMLSWRPLVFIGQTSYSLYLWHWPIVVLNRMYPVLPQQHSHASKLLLAVISFACGYLSWRFIETPFRRGRFRPVRRSLFGLTGAASAVLIACFALAMITGGVPQRFSWQEQRIATYRNSGGIVDHFRVGQCFLEAPNMKRLPQWQECLQPDPGLPNYLLLGSSLVAQLHDALQEANPDIHFLQATSPSCSVRLTPHSKPASGCDLLMQYIFTDYLPQHHVDAVIFQVEENDPDPTTLTSILERLKASNIRAIVVGSQVDYRLPEPLLAIHYLRHPHTFHLESAFSDYMNRNLADQVVAEREGATYLSMYDTLCPHDHCLVFAAPNVPMQTDQAHLTFEGTRFVARSWRDTNAMGSVERSSSDQWRLQSQSLVTSRPATRP